MKLHEKNKTRETEMRKNIYVKFPNDIEEIIDFASLLRRLGFSVFQPDTRLELRRQKFWSINPNKGQMHASSYVYRIPHLREEDMITIQEFKETYAGAIAGLEYNI